MSQALPEHIEALIDHGSTMRAEDDAAAFLIEVADALEAQEINEHQAYALASMLGFSRDQLRATTRQSN